MDQVRDELEEVDPIVSRFLEIGQEYHDNDEYEQAIEAYQQALEASPHNIEARLGLGNASLVLGDFGEAASVFEAVLEISPEDVAAQTGYCDAYMALGDFEVAFNRLEEAELAFQKVIHASPRHSDGLRRMAELHHRRAVQAIVGGEQAAVLELEKAKRFAPEDRLFSDLIDELIALSDGEKDLPQVLHLWGEKAIELELWDEAGDLFSAFQSAGGNPEVIEEHLEILEEKLRAKRISSYQQQAERMTRLRHYDEAIDALETILGLNPPDPGQIRDTIDELRSEQVSETAVTEIPPKPIWRRWWTWAGLVVVAILAIWLGQPSSPLRVSQAEPTRTKVPTGTPIPTAPIKPTATASPMPTVIPMQWQRQNSALFLNRDGITSILIDPFDDEVMYASTARAGVYKTINGGVTWFPIHNGLDHGWIQNLVMDPQDPDELYAGAFRGGLYRTRNGGESWELLTTGITDFGRASQVAINPDDPSQLVYSSGGDLSVSKDGGATWEVRDRELWGLMTERDDLKENFRNIDTVEFNPRKGELILVGRDFGPTKDFDCCYPIVRLSADNGANWSTVFQGERTPGEMTLFVSPYREEFILRSENEQHEEQLYLSRDDGRTWDVWITDTKDFPQAASSEGILYASYPYGIMHFDDDVGSWVYVQFEDEMEFHAEIISLSPTNPDLMVLGGSSVYVSKDGGETWRERVNGLPAVDTEIAHSFVPYEIYVKGRQCDSIQCGRASFRFFKFNLELGSFELISTDRCGENPESVWEQILCRYPDEINRTFHISPADPNYTYRVVDDIIECSNDSGAEWSNHWHSWRGDMISENVSSIAMHPVDPAIVYVATSSGLAITRTGCGQWAYPEELDGLNVNTVVINHENPDIVYVGTDAGAFISHDSGDGWGQVNDGLLGALVVYSITIDPNNPDNVYASTPYGIFRLENK
jgi:tetratricopeptide (TPR) repeat protein/photosystem II stability/assembly factor-like uncharacterized protein